MMFLMLHLVAVPSADCLSLVFKIAEEVYHVTVNSRCLQLTRRTPLSLPAAALSELARVRCSRVLSLLCCASCVQVRPQPCSTVRTYGAVRALAKRPPT